MQRALELLDMRRWPVRRSVPSPMSQEQTVTYVLGLDMGLMVAEVRYIRKPTNFASLFALRWRPVAA